MQVVTDSARFQVNVELSGDLKARYVEAMARLRRERADLMRIMVEDWLKAFESGGVVKPLEPLPGPSPPERPKSGERKKFTRR